ncbi:hypothetical protein BH10ACT1_BH10ACT1_11620 [soil metagenome]
MTTTDHATTATTVFLPHGSPADRLLTVALVVGPLLMLGADATYAFQGWDSGTGGVLHVLGAIAYGLLVLRVATWLPGGSWLTSGLVFTAVAGSIANAAYGFEAIHQSFGDTPLVDRSGAAILIKPLGLLFPLSLALVALALRHLGQLRPASAVLLAAVLWPIAHIANIAPLAVGVNVLLVVALGTRTGRNPVAGPSLGARRDLLR